MEQLSTAWQRATPIFSSGTWRKNAQLLNGYTDSIPLKRLRDGTYDIHESLRLARSRRDPLLAPHGFFRALPHRKNSAALEFVERFGPLDWGRSGADKLVFGHFWLKHLRYLRVVSLWEEHQNETGLRQAFADLIRDLHDVDWAEDPPAEPKPKGESPPLPLMARAPYEMVRRPWESSSMNPDSWLKNATFNRLQEVAISVFHSELNLHIHSRIPRWGRSDLNSDKPGEPVSFRLFLSRGTLWQYIWELTGIETSQVTFWRICPTCGTLFYPKRSDQFYCTSREQVLASKRDYARRRRKTERLRRVLEIEPTSKHSRDV